MIDILQYLPTGSLENAVSQSLPTGGSSPLHAFVQLFSLLCLSMLHQTNSMPDGGNHPACGKEVI